MDWRQFANATLRGVNVSAPDSSIPELANAARGGFVASAIDRAGSAATKSATRQADEDEKRAEAARQARMQEIQDMLDPSKYERRRKEDGGFAFFDPKGNEIDIDTYAKRTGVRRVDALQDSENPLDLQFIDDYEQMNAVNQAIWRNDTGALSEYRAFYPEVFGEGDKSPTPEEINRRLIEKYPHIFGRGNYKTSLSNLGNPIFRESAGGGGGGGYAWRR